jgi:hypothetical protein
MTESASSFELSRDIEHHLATLSKLYAKEGRTQKQEILVRARVRIHEEWSRDNWDGGTCGHALYLSLPEDLFLEIVRQKTVLQQEIASDINKIHNVQGEFIEEVFLERELTEVGDWRLESGLLRPAGRIVPPDAPRRIWGDAGYRVFFSHKAEVKKDVATLKADLRPFGVAAFVAHEDIHPTKEWQDEIENALSSMDAFVALMTPDFHDSLWTDQEVGYALGRNVPIIAVKLGSDPYGFIGRFQALSCIWTDTAREIVKLLITRSGMADAYISAVGNCPGWETGNRLSEILPAIERLTDKQVHGLVSAFNDNGEVSGSFGFNGKNPRTYGAGLASHLTRITGKVYRASSAGLIERIP